MYPPKDIDPEIKGQFIIESPAAIADDQNNVATLASLSWIESHGDDTDFSSWRDAPFVGGFDQGIREYVPGTVRALVIASYNARPFDPRVGERSRGRISLPMRLDLPPGAKIKCSGAKVTCTPATKQSEALTFAAGFGLRDFASFDVNVTKDALAAPFAFVVDITGIDTVAFATSRARARIQYPGWAITQSAPASGLPKITLAVGANVPSAGAYRWSEPTLGPLNNTVGWSYLPSLEPGASGGAPISGVNEGLLRSDADRLFWAGIMLGAAGAAALTILQLILGAVVRRWSAQKSSADSRR